MHEFEQELPPETTLRKGRKKGSYLYRQLAATLAELIEAGQYAAGQRLPSMEQLAAHFAVNKLTVYKALQFLSKEGYVRTVRARGTFVSPERAGRMPTSLRTAIPLVGTMTPDRISPPPSKGISNIAIVSRVMMPGLTGHYHLMLVDSIGNRLAAHGMGMLMLPTQMFPDEGAVVEAARRCGAVGLICVGELRSDVIGGLLALPGVPCVLLDYCGIGIPADTICQNNRSGAYLAVRHLLETGRRRIAIVCGPEDQRVSAERWEGAMHALREDKIAQPVAVAHGNFSKVSGGFAMRELLDGGAGFDAVFFMNDEMALGGLEVARERGLRVPQDFAVMGYDDIPLASESIISLSTVRAPVYQMGELAVEHLMEMRSNPEFPARTQEIIPSLKIRNTTAPVGVRQAVTPA